jgi:hypothetical protein
MSAYFKIGYWYQIYLLIYKTVSISMSIDTGLELLSSEMSNQNFEK